jgi:hypothetical protein
MCAPLYQRDAGAGTFLRLVITPAIGTFEPLIPLPASDRYAVGTNGSCYQYQEGPLCRDRDHLTASTYRGNRREDASGDERRRDGIAPHHPLPVNLDVAVAHCRKESWLLPTFKDFRPSGSSLFRRSLFDAGCNRPHVTTRVHDRCNAITPELVLGGTQYCRALRTRPLYRCIHVLDIHEDHNRRTAVGRRRAATERGPFGFNHDHRRADR